MGEQSCDISRVEIYGKVKEIFPNAKLVGYVPPRSAWAVILETYDRNLTNCELEGIHKVSQIYDEMYDFSIPSSITKEPDNTYDGSHFTPEINDLVAEIMQGEKYDKLFGVRVDNYSLNQYKSTYKMEMKKFLEEQNQIQRWKE